MNIIVLDDGKEYNLGSIKTRGGYVSDTNPLTEEKETYKITKTNTGYTLTKTALEEKTDLSTLFTVRNMIIAVIFMLMIAVLRYFMRTKRRA